MRNYASESGSQHNSIEKIIKKKENEKYNTFNLYQRKVVQSICSWSS